MPSRITDGLGCVVSKKRPNFLPRGLARHRFGCMYSGGSKDAPTSYVSDVAGSAQEPKQKEKERKATHDGYREPPKSTRQGADPEPRNRGATSPEAVGGRFPSDPNLSASEPAVKQSKGAGQDQSLSNLHLQYTQDRSASKRGAIERAIRELHQQGARFVLVRKDKRPQQPRW